MDLTLTASQGMSGCPTDSSTAAVGTILTVLCEQLSDFDLITSEFTDEVTINPEFSTTSVEIPLRSMTTGQPLSADSCLEIQYTLTPQGDASLISSLVSIDDSSSPAYIRVTVDDSFSDYLSDGTYDFTLQAEEPASGTRINTVLDFTIVI